MPHKNDIKRVKFEAGGCIIIGTYVSPETGRHQLWIDGSGRLFIKPEEWAQLDEEIRRRFLKIDRANRTLTG